MLEKFQPTHDDQAGNLNEITNLSNVMIHEISLNYSEETYDASTISMLGKGVEHYA